MIVGLLDLDLHIPASDSLKDKRHVLRSILDRLHNDFNVSAAEVGDNDVWRRARIAVVCVSNARSHVESVLGNARRLVEGRLDVEVLRAEVDWL